MLAVNEAKNINQSILICDQQHVIWINICELFVITQVVQMFLFFVYEIAVLLIRPVTLQIRWFDVMCCEHFVLLLQMDRLLFCVTAACHGVTIHKVDIYIYSSSHTYLSLRTSLYECEHLRFTSLIFSSILIYLCIILYMYCLCCVQARYPDSNAWQWSCELVRRGEKN